MKSLKTLILFVIIFTAISSYCQESLFNPMKFSNGKGDTLNYRILSPDYNPLQKYPLVIFLHGSGERGNDNLAQLKWGVLNFATDYNLKMHPSFVIAPQCPANNSWNDLKFDRASEIKFSDSASKISDLLIGLINKSIKDYPIDTNRIYITGLSLGGFGTYDLIMRYPNLFAAAAPVCGGGDTSKVNLIKHLPIWIFHGAEDFSVNPKYSLNMVSALSKAGAHPGYTQYPTVGHFSWIAAYSDPMFMEWLFRQNKSNNKR